MIHLEPCEISFLVDRALQMMTGQVATKNLLEGKAIGSVINGANRASQSRIVSYMNVKLRAKNISATSRKLNL